MHGLTLLFLAALLSFGQPPRRPSVLVLSGRNNHDWRLTTVALKQAIEAGGRFIVSVTERPDQWTPDMLARFDVIVSNWNTYGETAPEEWPEAAREALVAFVRRGGGHVTVHAGGSSFANWQDYRTITGIYWADALTGHGAVHPFVIRVTDPGHPITQGIRTLLTVDELWHRTGTAPGMMPLATAFSDLATGGSGADEPVLWAGRFGTGRTVALVLGHDPHAIATAGFGQFLRRSVEWAATGRVVTPPERRPLTAEEWSFLLDEARKYKAGDRRDALWMIEEAVCRVAGTSAARQATAQMLTLVTDTSVSPDARQFVCRRLGIIADPGLAAPLAKLLADPVVGTEARFALERIPGERVAALMLAALRSARPPVRLSLLNGMASHPGPKSTPVLTALAAHSDVATRSAAVAALGAVGTPAASAALRQIAPSVTPNIRAMWWRAQIACADRLARKGRTIDARDAYERLAVRHAPAHVRAAAISGDLDVAGAAREVRFLRYLRFGDTVVRSAALRAASRSAWALPDGIFSSFRSLQADVQAGVLRIAALRSDRRALPAAMAMSQAPNVVLRKAALSVIGALGGASAVPRLIPSLESSDPAVVAAATDALERLKGSDVTPALATLAFRSTRSVAMHLYRVLAARTRPRDMQTIIELCGKTPDAHAPLLPVVSALGGAEAVEPLLHILAAAGPDERDQLRNALIAVCSRTQTIAPPLRALASSKGPMRAALCSVVGAVESDEALKALEGALADPDASVVTAAVSALAEWNRSAPIGPLGDLVLRTQDPRLRTLTIRGVCRLAGLAVPADREGVVGLLDRCASVATAADRKYLAAALGTVPCLAALNLADEWKADPEFGPEATLSLLRIADALAFVQPAESERVAVALEVHPDPNVRSIATGLRLKVARGENLALGARATSTDGLSPDGAGSGPSAAVDGDLATYWDEQDDQPRYSARFELRSTATVAVLRIVGHQHHLYAPRDLDVLADGKVVAQVRDANYTDNVFTVLLPETRCSTVELQISRAYGRSPAIRELELYSRPPRSLQ